MDDKHLAIIEAINIDVQTLSNGLVKHYLSDTQSPNYDEELDEDWLIADAHNAIEKSRPEIAKIILQNFNNEVLKTSLSYEEYCKNQRAEDDAVDRAFANLDTYMLEQAGYQEDMLVAAFEKNNTKIQT